MERLIGDYIREYSVRNTENEDIPVYSVTNENGFCTGYFSKDVSSKDRTTYKVVPRGYFAYNPSRINVGSIDWQDCEEKVIVSPLYVIFEVSGKLDRQYLLHYLKSDVANTYIRAHGAGSVRDSLRFRALSEIPIRIVPVEVQREIVKRIDSIAVLIRKGQSIIENLDKLVKSRFVEMFGGVTSKGIPLKECCINIRGGGTPSMQHPEYYGGDVPFIKSGDVRGDTVSSGALWLTEQALHETTAKYVPKGSVLVVNRSAALLREFRAAVAIRPVVINQDIKAFIPKEEFTSEYLLWAIKIQTQYLLSKVTTVLTSHIDLKDLLELQIVPASIEKQMSFSMFIEQADKSKLAVKNELEKLEILKKSLMQQYFG